MQSLPEANESLLYPPWLRAKTRRQPRREIYETVWSKKCFRVSRAFACLAAFTKLFSIVFQGTIQISTAAQGVVHCAFQHVLRCKMIQDDAKCNSVVNCWFSCKNPKTNICQLLQSFKLILAAIIPPRYSRSSSKPQFQVELRAETGNWGRFSLYSQRLVCYPMLSLWEADDFDCALPQ